MSDTDLLQLLKNIHMKLPTSYDHTDELLAKLQGLVSNVSWSPAAVIELFEALLKRFDSKKTKGIDLKLWILKILHCIEINYITPSWKSGKTLVELIQEQTITDDELEQILSADTEKELDEIIEEIEQQKLVDKKLLDDAKEIVSAVALNSQLKQTILNEKSLSEVLQRLVAAVKKTQKISPRLTQMVSWSLMALSAKGRLIQVSTGEGKTCIAAMFAAFRALKGHKVDIMSSSPVLAERDFKEWQSFYKELKISVSCNINKSNTDLKKCYECQVVYGTAHDFAADWLRHRFSRKDIRGDRPFQCVVVDEVDSLMLDKGNHTVYLSCDMPGLVHLNPLLAHIWHTANQYTREGPFILGPKVLFHQIGLESLSPGEDKSTVLKLAENTGLIDKGSVNAFMQDPSLFAQITANITPEKLTVFFKAIEDEYMTCHFLLYKQVDGSIRKLTQFPQNNELQSQVSLLLHNGGLCQTIYHDQESLVKAVKSEITSTLHFKPYDLKHSKTNCYVPGFLRSLVESKIEDWIENAFYAQIITRDHQYVIESHGVVPVDFRDTGVLENSMQWTDGLHQFLQMKHQDKLSDMSAVTNFMSNVGLLHMYKDQIYGVTGTLGQKVETETLQNIYNGITACYIPTFKRRKLFEVEGVIVNSEDEWLKRICDIIRAQISCTAYRSERAVLVICETISRANAINEALGPSVQNKALYISNNMDNRAITDCEIKAGQVIIATNLAGRGTDLRVSAPVNSAGGLFVLQTFLPTNARVEAQAFGRTGRQGSPGSAQLVICCTHLPETLQLLMLRRGLLSLLRDMISLTPVYRHMFEMQLSRDHRGQRDNGLSRTLSQILMETSDTGINLAKTVRDKSVAGELKNYLEFGVPKIQMKQELFNQYLEFVDDFYRNSNQPPKSDVSALHEFWGMWLLLNMNEKDLSNALKTKLASDLEKARETLRQRQSPLSNLHHYTLFGNELLEKGDFEASILMFTKAIEEDRCWAAIAFYNRAFVRLIQQDNNQDSGCIDQALTDLHHALTSVELYCHQNDIVYRFSKTHLGTFPQDALTRFDQHQNMRCKVFVLFRENIEEAIVKLTKANIVGGHVKVEKELVHLMAPFTDYLPLLILSTESVSLLRSVDQLRIRQILSNPALDIFHEFECLESLGLTNVFALK